MKLISNRFYLLLLPLALCGFAVAQPVYNLLLNTPVFLLARQNTMADVWALAVVISVLGPAVLTLPSWLAWRRWPVFASLWCWFISGCLASLFVAQLLQGQLGGHLLLFIGLTTAIGFSASWLLLFSRWQILTSVLAGLAVIFPAWFLFFSTVAEQHDSVAGEALERLDAGETLPDIVFVILDELPLATLLDDNKQIDNVVFPGFARLQSMSNWYYNTITVSDGTVDAVPAILTGRYPQEVAPELTVAAQPVNLFTILGQLYQHNAAETVTRLCPQELCPRSGPGMYSRFKALLMDLSAIYLHLVVPDRWISKLPNVSNNWSGFFAERQVFFPDGWLKHAGEQTEIDRPAYFRRFIDSIQKNDRPVLNFMHILFPHEPLAYFPNGENYGLQWVRGQTKEHWGKIEWGLISGKQRHYLQTQYADVLLNGLLDHLQHQDLLNDSMIVVVADHGINFALDDARRALSDTNSAAMLRIPMFIKFPGQTDGKRIDDPAMTVDILPTLLNALGVSSESLKIDGIDLESTEANRPRSRVASSYLQRELKVLDETSLDITYLVQENRTQLKLDDPNGMLWQIGPFDEYRGQAMETLCEKLSASIKVHFDGFNELPNADPQKTVHSFVSGAFAGDNVSPASKPFLITSNGLIVASGHTWLFNDRWLFFALVEPKYVKQADWAPQAWLVEGGECLGR